MDIKKFNVDKDVAITLPKGSKWDELVDEMSKGDSVLMSEKEMKCFREHLRRRQIMCLTRRVIDAPDEEAFRVWRRS